MDDYHSWMYVIVIVLYVVTCVYNFVREGRIGRDIELKDSDFPSDIMVCSNNGRPWLYKRSSGEPLPPPPRIITNNCVHSFEERWLKTYGKTK